MSVKGGLPSTAHLTPHARRRTCNRVAVAIRTEGSVRSQDDSDYSYRRRINCSALPAGARVLQFTFIFLFLIMDIASMPERMERAPRNLLKLIIGRVRRLIARCSCSTMLFRDFFWGIRIDCSCADVSMKIIYARLFEAQFLHFGRYRLVFHRYATPVGDAYLTTNLKIVYLNYI